MLEEPRFYNCSSGEKKWVESKVLKALLSNKYTIIRKIKSHSETYTS